MTISTTGKNFLLRLIQPLIKLIIKLMKHDKNNHTESLRRFYSASLAGDVVSIEGIEAHHLIHVVRVKAGQEVELFDGKGKTALGTVEKAKRSEALIRITQRNQVPRPEGIRIHLQFAIPKSKRIDWLIEKATELGAASLQAVIFERSVSSAKTDKWLAHCISAAKQCGLNYLPEILPPASLSQVLEKSKPDTLKVIGDLTEHTKSLTQVLSTAPNINDIYIMIGPEGGFTDSERVAADKHGYIPVKIGNNILRIETAAIAMTAGVSAITNTQ